jgi:hypothetical protein
MNTLIDIQDKLLTAGAAIGRLEAAFSRKPSRSMEANILSLRKLQSSLQDEFAAAADNEGLNVCRYRILNDHPSAKSLASAISTFQDAVTQVFEAIRTGPRQRRNLSAQSESISELRVSYAFPGSFGIAFTIPNNKLLFDIPSQLDKAVSAVIEIATSDTGSTTIADAVKKYGRAPVVAIYDWAKVNSDNGIGAGIEWVRGDNTKNDVIVQAPQFGALTVSLEATKQSDSIPLHLSGILVGADIHSKKFHFLPDGEDRSIRGSFADAISEVHQAKLPAKYTAIMTKTTETRLATEVEKETYFLERLEGGIA